MKFNKSKPAHFLAVFLAVPWGLANAECPVPACGRESACAGGAGPAKGPCRAGEQAGPQRKRLVRPEDLLKDDQQTLVSNGVTIRKGTIGAFMQNAQIFSSPDRPAEDRAAALELLLQFALEIIAMDIDRQVTWRDPEIEKIMALRRTGGIRPAPDADRKASLPAKQDSVRPGQSVVRPQDLLSDRVEDSHFFRHGVKIRKGVLLSFFINGATFSSPLDPQEKAAARKWLVEDAPAQVALGMDQVMKWKDPEIQRILDQARAELFGKGAPGKDARS